MCWALVVNGQDEATKPADIKLYDATEVFTTCLGGPERVPELLASWSELVTVIRRDGK